jgi:hypothetical protein
MKMFNPKMKALRFTITAMILSIVFLFASCDNRDTISNPPDIDRYAPPVPTGVTTITLDRAVIIQWEPIILDPDYNDLAGYRIYRSLDNEEFLHIATVDADVESYTDENVQNGITYYYTVTSFDFDGNESLPSYDSAYDTPRPEGFDVYIYDFGSVGYSHLSGFDFSSAGRIPWDDNNCDLFAEYDSDPQIRSYFLWLGANGYVIQDMGYTDSFDDITYAPETGWSNFDYIEAIIGHTYVLRTTDNHYAKVRVTGVVANPDYGIIFDWGFQVDPGNRELKMGPTSVKPVIDSELGQGR